MLAVFQPHRYSRTQALWRELGASLVGADVIVVMEAGRIIEMGTHAELLSKGGKYRKLYELQFADEEDLVTL